MKVSFTLVFSGVFIAYVLHSVYSIAQLYYPPSCDLDNPKLCLSSFLTSKPSLQLLLVTHRTELHSYSQLTDENLVATWSPLDYSNIITKNLTIPLPRSTKRNGTLYLYAFLTELPRHKAENWISTIQQQTTMTASIQLTQYLVPEAKTFNLLGTDDTGEVKKKDEIPKVAGKEKPIAHITKKLRVTLLTDLHVLPRKDLQDLAYLIRIIHSDTYLPPLRFDKFASRIKDYYQMNKSEDSYVLELEYAPTSLGNLRLNAQFEGSMESMGVFGFTQRDLDDVKAIFLDTNVYLIGVTMIVASVHILFDFLAFKNDVNYWRHRKTTVGLSSRSLLWRCFSSIVVLLYLLEEKSSLLIIVPGGIGAVIEVWKVTKAFKIKVKVSKGLPRITFGTFSDSEKATAVHDVESMRYLSYLLYPLIAGGAVYSLLFTPHKSWYSWTIQTMVNGVYCFGFLFMLPQLFVNYRLKSVAHLPWRAFMYKAFNTFIDDLFAFIITMPTAHRLACFRDDIVFIVYLYQRWLYPVDQTRLDAGGEFEIDVNEATASEAEKKKN